ncbi:MAG TPA: ScpA family protein [Acetobacteraceae bacterium]
MDEDIALSPEALQLHLVGFEGPLDLLLDLARRQRVDLAKISIVTLVDQYIAAVSAADRVNLPRAVEWLVMAAWLTWLKSRLLLPKEMEGSDEAEQAAGVLADRLADLERVRAVADWLEARPQLGRDMFERGRPELGIAGRATRPRIDDTAGERCDHAAARPASIVQAAAMADTNHRMGEPPAPPESECLCASALSGRDMEHQCGAPLVDATRAQPRQRALHAMLFYLVARIAPDERRLHLDTLSEFLSNSATTSIVQRERSLLGLRASAPDGWFGQPMRAEHAAPLRMLSMGVMFDRLTKTAALRQRRARIRSLVGDPPPDAPAKNPDQPAATR